MLKNDLLPNAKEKFPHCNELVNEYRKIEEKVTVPRLAPGVLDGEPFDQALFERVIIRNRLIKYQEDFSKPLTTPLTQRQP